MGSAAVPAAPVGVAPTGSLVRTAPEKDESFGRTGVPGVTPGTARETRALPAAKCEQ